MSAGQRIARVVATIAAAASAVGVHFFVLLWVALAACGYDAGNQSAACTGDTVVTVWYGLVAAGLFWMLVAGALWIAGRDTAWQVAIAWLLMIFVAFVPVIAFSAP